MRRLERLGVWSWHSSRSVIHIRKGGVCVSSWPLVVAVSWQGRGCPREGCWPARLHSLRLIIFTRGLSSVRAPENRSFLFPSPSSFATVLSSTVYHVFARQFQMFNSFSFPKKLFLSLSFSSSPQYCSIEEGNIGWKLMKLMVSNFRDNRILYIFFNSEWKIISWWCPYWEENCINSKIYFGA